MRSLEDKGEGGRDPSVAGEDPIRFVRPYELPIGRIPAKTARMTESLRFCQIGFPGEVRDVQIPKRRNRLVEDLGEMRQLVSAGDGHAMMKFAASERL